MTGVDSTRIGTFFPIDTTAVSAVMEGPLRSFSDEIDILSIIVMMMIIAQDLGKGVSYRPAVVCPRPFRNLIGRPA